MMPDDSGNTNRSTSEEPEEKATESFPEMSNGDNTCSDDVHQEGCVGKEEESNVYNANSNEVHVVNEEPAVMVLNTKYTRRRVAIRTAIYFLYDRVSDRRKELCRILKVLLEMFIDECMPPPARGDMTFRRKCAEYLAPYAFASLLWYVMEHVRRLRLRSALGTLMSSRNVLSNAAWTITHRTARHALINRLFFRIGSLEYSLASLVGMICCFFREEGFFEIHRLHRWPKYFSLRQGLRALFKSFVYAAAFALPLHKASVLLAASRRRRGNVKKLIFAMALAQIKYLQLVAERVSSAYPRLQTM